MAEKVEFYRETEFKDTKIGKLPEEWEVMVAADVADYINGYPFSPTDWKMHGIPIIRIQNLNDPNAEFNCFDGTIDDIYKIKNGDLLFSWSASIGIYIWKGGDAVLNQHIFKVVPKANINKLFLYYDLLLAIEQLKSRVHGSTMKHFQKNELKTTFIPIPPLPEQQKIAEILSTVDESIQKTDDIIAKTERLKKGLMQELLTRGIGHKEFKDTGIGKIPKEWDVVKLDEVCMKIKAGGTPLTSRKEYYNGNIPFVKIEDMTSSYKYLKSTSATITEAGLKNSNAWLVPVKSLLVAMYGSIGAIAINEIEATTNQAILGILPIEEKTNVEFLFYLLTHLKPLLKKYAKQTTQANLTAEIIKNFKVALPNYFEQQKIAEILSTVDEKLEILKQEKVKLERIKRWFMQELLSGRIRVRVA